MDHDTSIEVSLRRKNFINFDNLTLYSQIILMTLLLVNYYGDSSVQKKDAYFCNYCLLIQFFSFLIVNLRIVLILDICKLKAQLFDMFFSTIYLLLNFNLILSFMHKEFEREAPPSGMVNLSEPKKFFDLNSILKLNIVILGSYRLIIEGTNLAFTTSYVGFVLLKSLMNKYKLKKLKNERLSDEELVLKETVMCVICLDHISVKDSDSFIRLRCHRSHLFHLKCMTTWCQEKISCPICKKCIFE
jgi:hypothetical protein